MNPWEEISLDTYEKHMSLAGVGQLQALHAFMRRQLEGHAFSTVMILGVAGGNGLDLLCEKPPQKVYGVDLNKRYLAACRERYPELEGRFIPVEADLLDEGCRLPHAELVIANLLVEYTGCGVFAERIREIHPTAVSVVLQVNEGDAFVSVSPYREAFDSLHTVCREVDAAALTRALSGAGYENCLTEEAPLSNGKKFVRLDFRLRKAETDSGKGRCGQ